MPEMGHTLPRLGFKMGPPPDGDRLSMISPDFEGNPGQPWGLQNGPILLANRGWGLLIFRVKLRASG